MALGVCRGSRVDPCQRLSGVDDREQWFVALAPRAVQLRNLQCLPRQQQLVVAPVLRVPQDNLAHFEVHIFNFDWLVSVALAAMDLAASTSREQLKAVVVSCDP